MISSLGIEPAASSYLSAIVIYKPVTLEPGNERFAYYLCAAVSKEKAKAKTDQNSLKQLQDISKITGTSSSLRPNHTITDLLEGVNWANTTAFNSQKWIISVVTVTRPFTHSIIAMFIELFRKHHDWKQLRRIIGRIYQLRWPSGESVRLGSWEL